MVIGRALGHWRRRGRRFIAQAVVRAEAAVAAAKRKLRDGSVALAACLVGNATLDLEQRALACALVDHARDSRAADHGSCRWQRLVDHEALLAVQEAHPVDAR